VLGPVQIEVTRTNGPGCGGTVVDVVDVVDVVGGSVVVVVLVVVVLVVVVVVDVVVVVAERTAAAKSTESVHDAAVAWTPAAVASRPAITTSVATERPRRRRSGRRHVIARPRGDVRRAGRPRRS
jgi:hypothetical protein